jgi:hypothetical protein
VRYVTVDKGILALLPIAALLAHATAATASSVSAENGVAIRGADAQAPDAREIPLLHQRVHEMRGADHHRRHAGARDGGERRAHAGQHVLGRRRLVGGEDAADIHPDAAPHGAKTEKASRSWPKARGPMRDSPRSDRNTGGAGCAMTLARWPWRSVSVPIASRVAISSTQIRSGVITWPSPSGQPTAHSFRKARSNRRPRKETRPSSRTVPCRKPSVVRRDTSVTLPRNSGLPVSGGHQRLDGVVAADLKAGS